MAIIRGEYAVNKKLPTEAQLCERYSVSRTIIRDALARLKEDGLVLTRKGSGSYVTTRPNNTVLTFSKISSISDIQRNFEFRLDLEGSCARFAAMRRTKEQLDLIIDTAETIKKAIEVGTVATVEDYDFHLAIAKAANNDYYPIVFNSLRENILEGINITRTLSFQSTKERQSLVQSEHDEIVDAIKKGDAEQAEKAMKDHIRNARNRMFDGT